MVRRLVKLLQSDLLPVATKENRSTYQAMITIKASGSTKEKAASVSKTGQTGSTTKASIKSCLFKQQTVATLKYESRNESLPEQLVYQSERAGNTIRAKVSTLV